jgi:hypothetical protein
MKKQTHEYISNNIRNKNGKQVKSMMQQGKPQQYDSDDMYFV